jgi:GT2 family glycosyltransferase
MKKNTQLAIILVNWNGTDDTINCIESIYKSTFRDYTIIVVDNGSDKGQLQKLVECNFKITLIKTGENLGYTGGNNVGIDYAIDKKSKYILLLNNDTYIAIDALENMMRSANSDKKVGVLSPKIFFHPDRHLIWSAGATFNDVNLIGHLTGYKEEDKEIYNQQSDVDYVSGCAMLIQTDVIKKVGKLCDDYFAVCEDIDFCFRVKEHGYCIRYEPSATVWHIESSSSGGIDSPQYVYYQTRNYFLFHKRWARGLSQLILSHGYYSIYLVKRGMGFILRGEFTGVLAITLGVYDFIVGKYGRRDYMVLNSKKKNIFKSSKNINQ